MPNIYNEIWRECPGFSNYEVSNCGGFRRSKPGRSTHVGRRPNVQFCRKGYAIIHPQKDGRQQTKKLHRLILIAFSGPPPFTGALCTHIDGNPANNQIDNLRWATAHENSMDRKRHGTFFEGEAVPMSKLKEWQVLEARKKYAAGGCTYKQLGLVYGVTASNIRCIINRKTWKHI